MLSAQAVSPPLDSRDQDGFIHNTAGRSSSMKVLFKTLISGFALTFTPVPQASASLNNHQCDAKIKALISQPNPCTSAQSFRIDLSPSNSALAESP
jgi:hypothetical protein